jgi:hypothetical protein
MNAPPDILPELKDITVEQRLGAAALYYGHAGKIQFT